MDAGADVVYGVHRRRAGETVIKRATAALFYRVIERLADVPIPRDAGDFRLISRRALAVLLAMPECHRFVRGMISWIGFRQVPLSYDREPRFAGHTKYPLRKMIHFAGSTRSPGSRPSPWPWRAGPESAGGCCPSCCWCMP